MNIAAMNLNRIKVLNAMYSQLNGLNRLNFKPNKEAYSLWT